MRNELALLVLVAAFAVAMPKLQRPSPQRAGRSQDRRRVAERESEQRVGSGLAGKIALGGMLVGTVGFLGELAAPTAAPLRLVLIASAFASLPAAVVVAWSQSRRLPRRPGSGGEWW